MTNTAALQFTDPKLGSELKFNVLDFKGPTTEKEDNHQSSMLESAKIFSEIWETGSAAPIDSAQARRVSHAWRCSHCVIVRQEFDVEFERSLRCASYENHPRS